MKLYIANQNYSSWSLRAWLPFAQLGLDAEIIKLPLFTDTFYQTLASVTPAAKVPVLIDDECQVWDSLAILEYLNECHLDGKAWPQAVNARAKARALACEMHSGFMALRNEMPMNCRATRDIALSPAALADIRRIDDIWSEQMKAYPGQWLFGEWSMVDAMYAPVALRCRTYQIALSDAATQYQQRVLHSPAILRWLAEAASETDIVPEDEAGTPVFPEVGKAAI
uniref:glutathione S-transferase family protein n=1 Tax=Thaumasiovibrio occultus TaxID=1891184 RepID=UPI000B3616B2|nr:glutathione S-transferase family protein [Thaumasiovibrio occultus]